MKRYSPESQGISSRDILNYIKKLEFHGLSTHNVIISKGDNIVFEKYWSPFDEKFLHRMYSVSKSIVAIAVGFLIQDGMISIEDSIEKYFFDELKNQKDTNLRNQTIKDMLIMSTAKPDRYWFDYIRDDRVKCYFENDLESSRPAGTFFQYDSSGTFILCALVERVTQMKMMDYLRIKLFDIIGVSQEAYCLSCPGGHSWGDSGVLCTARDLWLIAKFVMSKGKWNGKQILDEKYLNEATSKMIDNDINGYSDYNSQGYGYYIWKFYDDGFFFNGMGCQFAVCLPDKDLIFIYNGDNQGKPNASEIILGGFYDLIASKVKDVIIEDVRAEKELNDYCKQLSLVTTKGEKKSPIQDLINKKYYSFEQNPLFIDKARICFNDDYSCFEYYKNGDKKEIYFRMGENISGKFPEEGYSDEIGGEYKKGNYYNYYASGAWVEKNKLNIKVQIVDKYFGQLNISICFKDTNMCIYMCKAAENFLQGYDGYAYGKDVDLCIT